MTERLGYRGYVASRPVRGQLWPQHVQNLVIRDYAGRAGLHYLLSATEYAMPGCYMNLESLLAELHRIQGIVCFSLFMLPRNPARRRPVYDRLFAVGAELHGALEGRAVRGPADVEALEDIFMVDSIAPSHAMPV